MNVDNVLDWLSNVIKTTPDGIIQSLIVGIVVLVLRKILTKLPRIGRRFSEWNNNLSNFFNNNSLEISENTKIIPTPVYNPGRDFKRKGKQSKPTQHDKNMSDDNVWGIIILLLIAIVLIISIFLRYINEISLVLKWYGLVPLIHCCD